MCLAKNHIDVRFGFEFLVELCRISLIGQAELIAQVVKTIVDGGGGEHEHLGGYARLDDAVHQTHIAIFLAFFQLMRPRTIAEVMAFVDHH